MRRFRSRQFVVLAVVALSTWMCSTTTPTTPSTTPPAVTPPSFTETWTGPLTPHGAVTFPFSTNAAGLITFTLTSINPDSSLTLGLQLGVLTGTNCEVQIHNNTALQGTVLTGNAGAASNFCASVLDAAGALTENQTVTVTITHF